MKNNYMNFEVFNRYQELVEQHNLPEKLGQFDAINEAFDSSILRQLSSQESGSRWTNKFAKDFFKFSNIFMLGESYSRSSNKLYKLIFVIFRYVIVY